MKILISSFTYHPESIGLREHDLAVGLVNLGHEVIVITGLPSYPEGKVFPGYENKKNTWEIVDGVKIYRTPFIGDRSKSSFKRILKFVLFTFYTLKIIYLQKINPDIIRANQLGLPGYIVSMLKKIHLYLDVQDMWPEWTSQSSLSLSNLLFNLLDIQQRIIYEHAYKITTISPGFKKYLVDKGVPGEKIFIIPNWVKPIINHEKKRNEELGIKENLIGKFNLIYAGNLGSAQGINVIIEAAKKLEQYNDLQFLIIGDGIEKENLKQLVVKYHLNTVRFFDSMNLELLSEYISWADVLLLPLKKNPIYNVTIPSKTYTYLASGKPILVSAHGDVADLIRDINAGLIAEPDDAESLSGVILEFFMMDQDRRDEFGKNALIASKEKFNKDKLVFEFHTMLENNLGKGHLV